MTKLKQFARVIKDWSWFILVLRCNEFSPRLDLGFPTFNTKVTAEERRSDAHKHRLVLVLRRNKAHDMANKLYQLKMLIGRAMGT
jgi:hypothetical protein